MKYGGCIETYTGKAWHLISPNPADADIRDIAHSLARIQRFNGHAIGLCSVAAHSVFVSRLVPEELALKALLHDAEESVIGDISRPIKELFKQVLPDLNHIILVNKMAIYEGLGVEFPTEDEWRIIKAADNTALLIEAKQYMTYGEVWKNDERILRDCSLKIDKIPSCIYGTTQEDEKMFLDEYKRLTNDR